ncbi:hypothetical protein EJ05DRAFT_503099 [Pseudovirgaria hyperparasitica]|uniref:Aminoglycoside phosphotransferase domain-containing protein n=1 Tax=Pseudovirgaria hyperparasitica TaxID=470096 RepID=A0A6A6W0H7_9PEZI|nr:uncharacterized protein EJ05DRAFT_503099 [Pseudovirgaria hyperparasitica]KAF2755639.1 hypothetical protein EJ05DRAFT_503099 [Pseudovirgaria hyperparasitica]
MLEPHVDPAARESSTAFPLDGLTFDISSMPEEDLVAYGNVAPVLYSLASMKVVRLSKSLVMKFGNTVLASEGETMKYVAMKFPKFMLPRVHRCFNIQETISYFGDELSPGTRESVIKQVAVMINQLQSIRCDRPGGISGEKSRGMWFSDYGAGPFRSKEVFQDWIAWKLKMSKRYQHALPETLALECSTFVLVHGDISPRNLVLGNNNQIWMIDWGYAGFYPPIFEAATIKHQLQFQSFSQLLLPHIYNHPEELAQLEACSYGIHRVPFSLPPEMEKDSEVDLSAA